MYPIIRAKYREEVLEQKEYSVNNNEKMEYLTFPLLSSISDIMHMFSTRIGGASKNEFATLNFSFVRGDDTEAVMENYRRVASYFDKTLSSFVTTDQTHTVNIRVVEEADAGKGITNPRDYADVDGLITDKKGLILSCFYADCVPLYFVDPIRKVIGLAHSGWRGTVNGMGIQMVNRMQKEFGCSPKDIIAAVGPSICRECYEISEEVAVQFQKGVWEPQRITKICAEAYDSGKYPYKDMLTEGKGKGKYQLDLWLANYVALRMAGICLDNISVTDVCTCCNEKYLFSHRATGGKRGNLGAFLMLK